MNQAIQSDMELLKQHARGPRVLFIEDDEMIRQVFSVHAQSFDCEFSVAETGERALQLVKDKEFDTIFLDMRLPDIPGLHLFQLFQSLCPLTNIVVVSGHISDQMIAQVMDIGFAIFVRKPSGFRPSVMDKLFSTLGIHKLAKFAFSAG